MGKVEEKEVVENKEDKKVDNIKYIILLMVATLFGFLVGFGLTKVEMGTDKKEDKNDVIKDKEYAKDDEDKIEKRQLPEFEKAILLDQIYSYNMRISKYYNSNDLSISDQDLLYFAHLMIIDGSYNDASAKIIAAGRIESVLNEYFYMEREIKHQDIMCNSMENVVLYNYDPIDQVYIYNEEHYGHGASVLSDAYTHYLEGYFEADEVIVKTKILYGDVCMDLCGPISYYGSYDDAFKHTNPLFYADGYDIVMTDELYETVADELKTTVFTFVKDSAGNYGLKSVVFE